MYFPDLIKKTVNAPNGGHARYSWFEDVTGKQLTEKTWPCMCQKMRRGYELAAAVFEISGNLCDGSDLSSIQRSNIRAYAKLQKNKNSYNFQIVADNGSVPLLTPNEKRLSSKNAFLPIFAGMQLATFEEGASGVECNATYASCNELKLKSPEAAKQLDTVFSSGQLDLKLNKKTIFECFSTQQFRHVPGTQNDGAKIVDQYDWDDIKVCINDQDIIISGSVDVSLGLTLNTEGVDFDQLLEKGCVYVVLMLEGWEIVGGADMLRK